MAMAQASAEKVQNIAFRNKGKRAMAESDDELVATKKKKG
jgi:hypothetical protein